MISNTLRTRKGHDALSAYLFISPFFLIFAVFGFFPLLYTSAVSMHRWNILSPPEFRGLSNYALLFQDPTFWKAVANTFLIWMWTTVPQLFASLILAVMLNQAFVKGKNLFRLFVFVPNVTSTVAVALIFSVVFSRQYGLVNQMIAALGFEGVDWSGNRLGTHIAIATMVNWRWTGHGVIIFLAALQAIPKSLYESAHMDGASAARQFFSITIPMIRPIIIFKVILSTIGGLQLFVEPLIFSGTGGGPARQGLTMTLYLYEEAFTRFSFGYASAIAWTLFLIIVLFSLVNYFISSRIKSV